MTKIVSEKVAKLYKLITIAKMEVSQNIEPFLPQEKKRKGGDFSLKTDSNKQLKNGQS